MLSSRLAPICAGRTRLLYRMSLDFLGWTRNLPGIGAFWKSIAEQVGGWLSLCVCVRWLGQRVCMLPLVHCPPAGLCSRSQAVCAM